MEQQLLDLPKMLNLGKAFLSQKMRKFLLFIKPGPKAEGIASGSRLARGIHLLSSTHPCQFLPLPGLEKEEQDRAEKEYM